MLKIELRSLGRAMAFGLCLVAAGCVTSADLEEVKKGQEEIKQKLDKLSARGMPAERGMQAQRPSGPDPSKTYAVDLGDAVIKGPNDAWVTIVEVSDFQCPFCNRVNPTMKEIQDKYKNDVRIAFMHNPLSFHQRAKAAALAAECARDQDKFWEMHDAMFQNQRALEDADLEKYAGQAGVNVGKWKSCYTAGTHNARIDAQQQKAVSMGARGTPAFFVNGRFISGAQPFASFQRVIDEELEKAKKSGIAKGEYYAKAVVEQGEKKL